MTDRTSLLKVFVTISGVLVVLSWLLFGSFAFQNTGYFEYFHLDDPSKSKIAAGWWFGIIISLVLACSMTWLVFLFREHVLAQYPALLRARVAWDKQAAVISAGAGGDLNEILPALTQAVAAPETRVGAVLKSWQDASPDSDAEYVIEGRAAHCRQQLGVLQTVASILVLVGLVGNFFGLADAVKGLPKLAQTSTGQQVASETAGAEPGAIQTQRTEVKTPTGSVPKDTHSSGTPQADAPAPTGDSDSSAMDVPIQRIASALSVVVVSSVVGIGGMAVLLLFVSIFKSIFNEIVTEETVLMAAEIGSLVRPSGGGGGFSDEAKEAILLLPARIQTFEKAATAVTETFGKSGGDLQVIAKSLEELLKVEMIEAKGAYQTYQQSLDKFTEVITEDRETVKLLVEATTQLCKGMDGLAKSVHGIAETTEKTATSYQETQAKYENYLQIVTEQVERRTKEFDRKAAADRGLLETAFRELSAGHDKLVDQLITSSQETLSNVIDTITKRSEESFRAFGKELTSSLSERHEAEMEALKAVLSESTQQTKDLARALESSEERSAESHGKTMEAAQKLLEETGNKFLDVGDQISATQDTTIKALVKHWQDELTDVSDRFGQTLELNIAKLLDKLEASNAPSEGANVPSEELNLTLRGIRETLEKFVSEQERQESQTSAERTVADTANDLSTELRPILEKIASLEFPTEMALSRESFEELQRPLLELAALSKGKEGGVDSETIAAALTALKRSDPVELSEATQRTLSESFGKALNAQISPLLNTLEVAIASTRQIAEALQAHAPRHENSRLSQPTAGWHCNVCGATNPKDSRMCSDCMTPKELTSTAPSLPAADLESFVSGLQAVLHRELQALVETIRSLATNQPAAAPAAPMPDLSALEGTVSRFDETTRQALADLKGDLEAVLVKTNETIDKLAPAFRDSMVAQNEEVLTVLRQIDGRLAAQSEPTEQPSQETQSESGFRSWFSRSKKKGEKGS